ncbi:MAG: hypothetical protein ABIC40_03680 [bacterium]
MKGSEIIKKIGVEQVHCFIEKEMIKLDPEYDYVIVNGTDEIPKVVCPDHEKAIHAGRYPRLKIDGKTVISDPEWTTGHSAFENHVEPRFSQKREKTYTIQ